MSTETPESPAGFVLTPFSFSDGGRDVVVSLVCQTEQQPVWAPEESQNWSMRDAALDDLQPVATRHMGTIIAFDVRGTFLTMTVAIPPSACLRFLTDLDQRLHWLGIGFVDVQIDGR